MKLFLPTFAISLLWNKCHGQFSPDPINESCGLSVLLEKVGSIPANDFSNIGHPVAVGRDRLLLVDQGEGIIYLDKTADGNPIPIFNLTDAPAGLNFDYPDVPVPEYIVGVAPGPRANLVYVAFQSKTLPPGITPFGTGDLPDPLVEAHSASNIDGSFPAAGPADLYRLGDLPDSCALTCCLCNGIFPDTLTIYHVIYTFKLAGKKLSDPVGLTAFATQASPTHKGGGMETLPDGRLLYATGDGLPFGTNGREGTQDETTSVGKLFAISRRGKVEVLAKGLRQTQHLELVDFGNDETPTLLAMGEVGGVTAEEINIVSVADLLDTSVIENLGWGIGPDGNGREGTFYVGPGVAGIFGTQPPSTGIAPVPEPGFIQPHAQYGRADPGVFIAVSGPVTSVTSFTTLKTLFGDITNGQFFATVGDLADVATPGFYGTAEEVCSVTLVDSTGASFASTVDLVSATGRASPRFFRFPDGTAGVMLEQQGSYYRITQL